MARRILRVDEDPILRKKSKPIKDINNKIIELAEDMVETLGNYDGVGLAAPQVGILKRIIVVDFSDDENYEQFKDGPIVAINPEILGSEGSLIEKEACLSFPEQFGKVERPQKVTVKYTDLDGNEVTDTYEDMVARCFCHEIDHLDGVVYLDRVIDGTLNVDEEHE